jgi:tRNA (adenine22-N1)-methyltransferase
MRIPLSKRLQRCADYIGCANRIADIGCDHGYLGISLLKNGQVKSVIAADIRPMPLQAAKENAKRFGFDEQMEFFLSDGASAIPRDFDVMVCAGMGADTMISIIENAPWLKSTSYRLVLQCQSKTAMLRKYLNENGFSIVRESAIKDGRFLYSVMEVVFKQEGPFTPGQCHFSPALAKELTEENIAYYRQVVTRLEREVAGQKEAADPVSMEALRELKENAYDNR